MKYLLIIVFTGIWSTRSLAQNNASDKGVIEPRIENKESVFQYLNSMGIDTNENYYINEKHVSTTLKQTADMPVLFLFDRHGFKLKYTGDRVACTDPTYLLATLRPNHGFPIDTSELLNSYLNNYVPYSNNHLALNDDYDFTVLIYWVRFLGDFDNNEKVKRWESILHRNEFSRVRVIKINMDVQETWSTEARNKHMHILSSIYKAVVPYIDHTTQYID